MTLRSATPKSRRSIDARQPMRDVAGADQVSRSHRAIWLVLLTAVIPGSAQLVAGNRDLGRFAIRMWLLTLVGIVGAGVVYFVDSSIILGALSQTWSIQVLMAGVFGLAVGWALLFMDSLRIGFSGRPAIWSGAMSMFLSAMLVVLTCGPLVYAGRLLQAHNSLVGNVFAGGSGQKPTEGRYNVLLIGGDAGSGRAGLRNDTNILLSIDADTGKAVQVGIPRNIERAPFPKDSPMAKEHPNGFKYSSNDTKINAVYRWAHEHPELYPNATDPGAEAVKDAVSGITGLTVQYYILVDMQGFESMIDALGGIDMDVRKRVPKASITDKKATEFIEVGQQHLDGADALWFARSRFGTSDYERMARQRCVISAAINQLEPTTVMTRYANIAASSPDLISTDIPQRQLGKFAQLALKTRSAGITNLQLTPPEILTYEPDYPKIRRMVAESMLDSARAPAPAAGGGANEPPGGAPAAGGNGATDEATAAGGGAGQSGAPPAAANPNDDGSDICSA